tara:strand:+ start:9254 stop:10039 length:786 start_codon:yes stop_codon:yes gene_type:complete
MGSSFGVISQTGNNIQTEGLVFYIDPAYKKSWSGPESSDTNTLVPNSIFTGSINNDTSGSYGQYNSFTFDGTDSYINVAPLTASINTATVGTISLWTRIESNSSYSCLFSGTRALRRTSFALRLIDSGLPAKLHMTFRKNGEDPSHVAFQTTNTEINADTWYNITVTQDGTAAVCYINGSTVSLENLTGGNPTTVATMWYNYITPTELYIGKNRVANQNNPGAFDGQYWDGQMGPILFYNRALSAEDVLQNYNAQKGRFGL